MTDSEPVTYDELVETVIDLLFQSCHVTKEGRSLVLDSMANGGLAEALRVLARLGRVDLLLDRGRLVRARWIGEEAEG